MIVKLPGHDEPKPDSDPAPDGSPKMLVGRSLWAILERDGEDMRFYRLNKSIPMRASQLFKQH